MGRERMKSLRISPDFISHLNQDEILVFGSNLQGHHEGGAAKYAYRKFGAKLGEGDGMTGKCYAIPTMHGELKDVKPYVDKFISYAKRYPQKHFLVTRIGCGIAGFYDGDMSDLFKEAIKLNNVSLPRKWVELILQDEDTFKELFGDKADDYDYYYLNAVRENDLVYLSRKYKDEISRGDKSNLPKINIRYILSEEERFGFADFGDCFMLNNGDLYIFTDEKDSDYYITDILRMLFFGFEIKRKQGLRKVLFAGVRTHYRDSYGDAIFTGDVLELGHRDTFLAIGPFGWNDPINDMKARYAFVLDNHCLFPEDAGKMTRVGTVFYNLHRNKPVDVAMFCHSFQGGFPGDISQEEKMILASHTPSFIEEGDCKKNKETSLNKTDMTKIGRIKSWYVDPDDPNQRKVMYTTHNYLLVTIVDGIKFYAALHDTYTNEDDAIALEIGDFELNGMNFNARFDDYRGYTNYTNVSLS